MRHQPSHIGTLKDDIEFVFEDGGPDKSGLVMAMDVARKLPVPIFKLRRSPRMTHLCSPKVIHTKNAVCRRARIAQVRHLPRVGREGRAV